MIKNIYNTEYMQLNMIKQMERIAREDSNIVSLGQGIPAWPSDTRIRVAAAAQILTGKADHYSDPQGIPELRDAVAVHLKTIGMEYSPSEVIVTAGAIEALGVAVRGVVSDTKNQIVTPVPVYSAYFKLIELAGGKTVEVMLDENAGWSLDADTVIAAMNDETAGVLLCNPNNPTGTVFPEATLRRICAAAKSRGIAVIVDEVYRNMIYDGASFYSPASSSEFRDTIIRVMSFSKDFALTGWRIGYLHASSDRIPALLGIHDTLVNCTPVASQYAAVAALAIYDDVIRKNKKEYTKNREYVAKRLDELVEHVQYDMPQGAYFFFPKLIQGSSERIVDSLIKHGVVTIPGHAFGGNMHDRIRLCFGRDEQSLIKGMDRFVSYFTNLVVE